MFITLLTRNGEENFSFLFINVIKDFITTGGWGENVYGWEGGIAGDSREDERIK